MVFNLATTVSFCAAAIALSVTGFAAYLGQRPGNRHFRYAAVAGFAAALYCMTDATLAAGVPVVVTIWAGRLSAAIAGVHGAAWLAATVAWDKRSMTRFERATIAVGIAAGLLCLVPGVAVGDGGSSRAVDWLGITYVDPEVLGLGAPLMTLCYLTHVVAAVTAFRISRRRPHARAVAIGLSVFCIVIPLDSLSAMHAVNIPYLADPAIVFVFVSIGSVVVRDAAESADKSVELERARVALAERENLAALGQLAAVMAHEVRNPVAIIFGALATLQRVERDEQYRQLLGIVGEEAQRLDQLVSRLLDAVRPFELQYSLRSIQPLLESAISQVTTSKGVAETEVALDASPSEEVECDDVLLVQAIANLVQNAIVASGRRSPVSVRAMLESEARPAMLRVEVADDGEGVPPETRARLFTPFFTTRATGTGLGLALVKRIAGAHGGTVDYAPPDGRGACFVLRVPLRARDAVPLRIIGNEVR